MRIHFDRLQEKAKHRPEGYLLDVLAVGVADGDFLRITNIEGYYQLCAKYGSGVGTAVEKVAKPIARVIDKITGTKLEGCKPCQKRKARLNGI